jgi:hypothetical protein
MELLDQLFHTHKRLMRQSLGTAASDVSVVPCTDDGECGALVE